MATHTILGSKFIPRPKTKHLSKLNDTHKISSIFVLGADCTEADVNEIIDYCSHNGLTAIKDDSNHIMVSGFAKDFNKMLQIEIQLFLNGNAKPFHAPVDDIQIPQRWENKIVGILGLNTRPILRTYYKMETVQSRALTTFDPLQLATLYNFPTNLDGTGQKIGIIELGGGYKLSDITTYFNHLGITATPNITAVSVDGVPNNPSDTSGANVEVILDIEVIAAIVPKAAIRVYFGLNSDAGFYNAINKAIQDGCGIISISWGGPEAYWSSSTLTSYNNLFQSASTKNITILAAAGDSGSSDGASGKNVDFPSSSPYVLACGGTRVEANAQITSITKESVWNVNSTSSATGGGISAVFSKPSYQANLTYNLGNHRGVPDVAGNADPTTGYKLYYNGQNIVVGGTSAVAPLWSGLLGRINQSLNKTVGFIHQNIYSNMNVCNDITIGNNGAFTAGTGWDACTGCGSFNGTSLLNLLNVQPSPKPAIQFSGSPVTGTTPMTVNFIDSSTNTPTDWLWDFGDSTTSTSQNPSHTYTIAGAYNVSLQATNNAGSNKLIKNSYINANAPLPLKPVVAFSASIVAGVSPMTVTFTDESTNNPTSWLWNFGDNNKGNLKNPVHVYRSAGIYTVSLTSSNSGGSNILTKTNFIHVVTMTANFSANSTTTHINNVIRFVSSTTGNPTSFLWNFGDNTTSISQNPSHSYKNKGKYNVSLTITKSNISTTTIKNNYITIN